MSRRPWPECELILPADAPREEWLLKRGDGLGGSDMVVLMGYSYQDRTEHRLWLEKTGRRSSESAGTNIRMRRGNHMEAFIAAEFEQVAAQAFGPVVIDQVGLVRHVEDEMVLASADYRVKLPGWEREGLECKNVDNYPAAKAYRQLDTDWRSGESGSEQVKRIAPRFYWQMVHYLAATGAAGWWLAIDSPFYEELMVARIDALEVTADISRAREKARTWWTRHIVLGFPVDPVGEELKAELGELLEDAIEAERPWELEEDLERWKELAYPGTAAGKAELAAIKKRVADQMAGHQVLNLYGEPVVQYQSRKNPGGLMKEALEADHPGLLAKYTASSTGRTNFVALVRAERTAPQPGGAS